MQTNWSDAVCKRRWGGVVDGMFVIFKREIVADDNMPVCPEKRLELGTFDGMSLASQAKFWRSCYRKVLQERIC